MVGYAFTTLKLHRVEANIMPENKASLALIRKCGFRFEGLAKRYLQINGRWSDHERWGMTIEDWKPLKKRTIRR
jgi:ribosomal-protein-alanine N-acetyltransferase